MGAGLVCIVAVTTLLCSFYPRKARSAMIVVVEGVEHWFGSTCVGSSPQTARHSKPGEKAVTASNAKLPRLIAHAGGGIRGLTYTNSLEALSRSMALGCTVLEIDLAWTSDNRLVLLHDWGPAAGRHFGKEHQGKQMSYRQFINTPRTDALTSMGEEDLLLWLEREPGARVVLDAKWRALEAFERLYQMASTRVRSQLIAQAYQLDQVAIVRDLGFAQVLLTLYRSSDSSQELMDYLARSPQDIVGVAMPVDLALGPLGKRVAAAGQPTFAHPVNSRWLDRRLAQRNIGVFSSRLCACASASSPLPAAAPPSSTANHAR